MKLIDKDALVAEIKELEDEAKICPSDFYCGRLSICKELMNFLNTLEVKDVENFTDTLIRKAALWFAQFKLFFNSANANDEEFSKAIEDIEKGLI